MGSLAPTYCPHCRKPITMHVVGAQQEPPREIVYQEPAYDPDPDTDDNYDNVRTRQTANRRKKSKTVAFLVFTNIILVIAIAGLFWLLSKRAAENRTIEERNQAIRDKHR